MLPKLLFTALLAGAFSAGASTLPAWLTVEPTGILNIDGARLEVFHYGAGWSDQNFQRKLAGTEQKRSGETLTVAGTLGPAAWRQRLTPLGAESFRYTGSFSAPHPVETLNLSLNLTLNAFNRTIRLDGREFRLFAEYDAARPNPIRKLRANKLCVPLDSGAELRAEGEFELTLVDNRRFGAENISLRFSFAPSSGRITKSGIDLAFRRIPFAATAVDLSKAANMGFRDDVANDGRGGWTDQGPENDLRQLRPGFLAVGDARFPILDPGRNGGNSALVLGRNFPREASVPVDARQAGYLCLIHASAWTAREAKTAEIRVDYRNGESETFGIFPNRDVGNWWGPQHAPNAVVVWNADNGSNLVGLYLSQFRLRRNDPVRLTFRAFDEQLWMVPAALLAEREIPAGATAERDGFILPGPDWIELDTPAGIRAGSPLDFSDQLDAPAGKYGRVIATPDGHFAFENAPHNRIRFIGINLCFTANYLEHSEADALAEKLARSGYNALRIHHHDRGLLKADAPDSLTLDPVQVDKLDYLFAACKKRGIYITTDVYVNRVLKPGDRIPELAGITAGKPFTMKSLLPVSAAARENWKSFARRWLGHVNPYTGMSWAGDPALAVLSLTNENNLDGGTWKNTPQVADIYRRNFPAWMAEHHPGEPSGITETVNRRFVEYLMTLQKDSTLELMRFLKEELKVAALCTDLNMHNRLHLAIPRSSFDTVDSHKYADHPVSLEKPWDVPMRFRQTSSLATFGSEVPGMLFSARLFGKPFSVTEYAFCRPNRFRSEGAPLIGAVAALQGWDALYQFAWSHSDLAIRETRPRSGFDYANDPFGQLSDRLTMLMLRRGDVSPSRKAFGLVIPPGYWKSDMPLDCPAAFNRLGFLAKTGLVHGDTPAGVTPLTFAEAEGKSPLPDAETERRRQRLEQDGVAVSDTGELRLDSRKRTLAVVSPRTVSATVAGGGLSAGPLAVAGAAGPQTLSVSSLDGRPVTTSRKLLVFHLTDTLNSRMKFRGDGFRRLEHWGGTPLLLRRDPVKVTLKLDGSRPAEVEALKLDGEPYGPVSSRFSGGILEFTADPGLYRGGVMAYLITRP